MSGTLNERLNMHETKSASLPIIIEPPSVIDLYIQLAVITLTITIFAVIAGLIATLLRDYVQDAYRRWINYLE